jgi:hypothetical protein
MKHTNTASFNILRRKLHLAEPILAASTPPVRAPLAAVQAFVALPENAPPGVVGRTAQRVLEAQYDAAAAKRRARSARTKAHAEIVYELASAAYRGFLAADWDKPFEHRWWAFDRAMKIAVGIDPVALERAMFEQRLLEDDDDGGPIYD